MNQNKNNIFKKAFIEAMVSSIGLVIGVFIVYLLMKATQPNLLILGLTDFASFYLVKVLLFKIRQNKK